MTGAAAQVGQLPLVRDRHGAILGIDWRQSEFADESVRVPGVVPARAVMTGDTIQHEGEPVVVHTKRGNGVPGRVYVGVVTAGGAEIVHEMRDSQSVRVIATGAFEPGAGS